jgi:hypothetical protein
MTAYVRERHDRLLAHTSNERPAMMDHLTISQTTRKPYRQQCQSSAVCWLRYCWNAAMLWRHYLQTKTTQTHDCFSILQLLLVSSSVDLKARERAIRCPACWKIVWQFQMRPSYRGLFPPYCFIMTPSYPTTAAHLARQRSWHLYLEFECESYALRPI